MSLLTGLFGEILKYIYGWTGDYGIAIVCLTVLVKLLLLPLQAVQRRKLEHPQKNPSGCLILLLQIPIMLCLYRSIRMSLIARVGTILLPWVESLLVRDASGILPVLSAAVQLLPQIMPYLTFFRSLNLPKPAPGQLLTSAVMTIIICFPLPSGVGMYYLVSGLFSAAEQTVRNIWCVRKMKTQSFAVS